jgi:hypothetical protein
MTTAAWIALVVVLYGCLIAIAVAVVESARA